MDERFDAYSERAPANNEREGLESDRGFAPAIVRPGDLLARDVNGLPYRVDCPDGQTHAVVGSRLVADDPYTFFVWTRCGIDVDVREVYVSREHASCPACAAQEADAPQSELRPIIRLRLADLAYARARQRVAWLDEKSLDATQARDNERNYRGIVAQLEKQLQP